MTEAVISDLARIKALRVISRTSAMHYKGTALSLPEIARELNVEAILEGSAHLVGGRVRLSVQLIAARTDETLWADRYDRQLEDVLGLQSELAEKVAREIAVQLTPTEVTAARAPSRGEPGGASRISQGTAFIVGRIARRGRSRPPSREAGARNRSRLRRGVVGARRLPHPSRDARDGAAGRGRCGGRGGRPASPRTRSLPRRCARVHRRRPDAHGRYAGGHPAHCAMPSN